VARLQVWLQPGASREGIAGFHGEALKVSVTAPPEKGKANKALERLLARALSVPASAVAIVAGSLSRSKTVHIEGLSDERLAAWLKDVARSARRA